MLIDEAHLTVKAGNGGDGRVHLYHDRHRPKGGPDGGDGGHGGSVYFRSLNDIGLLSKFRFSKKIEAQNGEQGGFNQSTGANGQDLIIDIPIGTMVSYDNGTQVEFTKVGQTELIAKGGRGGHGNYYYRSAIDQTPTRHQKGRPTEIKNLFLELKLIAKIGLIGLPNAGKTSLLNELTAASAKVANYPFTTLEPNLGVTKGNHIIADIPGLIEGASLGKGLGFKFLKHVERTEVLIHCLAADSVDPLHDYEVVRNELSTYSASLASKPEILVVTKSDLVDAATLKKIIKTVNAKLSASVIDDESIKKLNDQISSTLS